MKNGKAWKVITGLLVASALFMGCDPPEGESLACKTDMASLMVINNSKEAVDLSMTGPSAFSETIADGATVTYAIKHGDYDVQAIGRTTEAVVLDESYTFKCDAKRTVTLVPVTVVPPPLKAELDLYNDTGETLDVYIDSVFENTLVAGEAVTYELPPGPHSVTIKQVSTDAIIYDDALTPTNYSSGDLYELHITSRLPFVKIQNDTDLDTEYPPECVATWVDYDLGFTSPVLYDNGNTNVCPNEIGSFTLAIRGEHEIEVKGEDSGFFFIDEESGRLLFPENTTTTFVIK